MILDRRATHMSAARSAIWRRSGRSSTVLACSNVRAMPTRPWHQENASGSAAGPLARRTSVDAPGQLVNLSDRVCAHGLVAGERGVAQQELGDSGLSVCPAGDVSIAALTGSSSISKADSTLPILPCISCPAQCRDTSRCEGSPVAR